MLSRKPNKPMGRIQEPLDEDEMEAVKKLT